MPQFERNERPVRKEIRKSRKDKVTTETKTKIKQKSPQKSVNNRFKNRETPNKTIEEKEITNNKPKINEFNKTKEKLKLFPKDISMPENSEKFKEFLQYTHGNESIKEIVNEFNNSGCWIKNFRPTQTFIDFIKNKKNEFEDVSQTNHSTLIKDQTKILSHYITLTTKIRDEDVLNNTIKNLVLKNKGKFNAYDIQKWLLISDTSARNQLKRIFIQKEYRDYIRTQKHVTIDTILKIAKKKGGKCHTTDLENAKSKIHLECAEGHHFYTTYNSVVYSKTWCPHCHLYISETICRRFFEKIFKKSFPKSYPKWLVNENGNQMELDGYNEELGLAFEYQGIQHRKKAFGMTEEELKKLQEEDALKLKLCKDNGVTLIQVPDDKIVPYYKMQKYIEQEYKKKTKKDLKKGPRYDYREFIIHENKYAKKFRDYVEKKGGALITPYFTAKKEVTIMCEKGHQWTTTPDSVYKNNWCSKCAGNEKGTTEYFQEIGRIFNCKLVNEYVNAKTPLWYQCQKGHKFKKSPEGLKRHYKNIENFCPECKMDKYAKKFQGFIHKKGWSLLTPYKGRFKTITIKCKNEHVWNTTPGAVYQGSRCQECKKKN
ncbi:MAG: hypothetical protein ACFFCE_00200 [Promethearchaeota archaeon]